MDLLLVVALGLVAGAAVPLFPWPTPGGRPRPWRCVLRRRRWPSGSSRCALALGAARSPSGALRAHEAERARTEAGASASRAMLREGDRALVARAPARHAALGRRGARPGLRRRRAMGGHRGVLRRPRRSWRAATRWSSWRSSRRPSASGTWRPGTCVLARRAAACSAREARSTYASSRAGRGLGAWIDHARAHVRAPHRRDLRRTDGAARARARPRRDGPRRRRRRGVPRERALALARGLGHAPRARGGGVRPRRARPARARRALGGALRRRPRRGGAGDPDLLDLRGFRGRKRLGAARGVDAHRVARGHALAGAPATARASASPSRSPPWRSRRSARAVRRLVSALGVRDGGAARARAAARRGGSSARLPARLARRGALASRRPWRRRSRARRCWRRCAAAAARRHGRRTSLAVPLGETAALPLCLLHARALARPCGRARARATVASGALVARPRHRARVRRRCTCCRSRCPRRAPWQLAVIAVRLRVAIVWARAARPRRSSLVRRRGDGCCSSSPCARTARRAGAPRDVLRRGSGRLGARRSSRRLAPCSSTAAASSEARSTWARASSRPRSARGGAIALALVVLTHPHPDHFGGLDTGLGARARRRVLGHGPGRARGRGRRLRGGARARMLAEYTPRAAAGDALRHRTSRRRASSTCSRRAPRPSAGRGRPTTTRSSSAFAYGARALPVRGRRRARGGGASSSARYARDALGADVLKVGHHGSRTSTHARVRRRGAPVARRRLVRGAKPLRPPPRRHARAPSPRPASASSAPTKWAQSSSTTDGEGSRSARRALTTRPRSL